MAFGRGLPVQVLVSQTRPVHWSTIPPLLQKYTTFKNRPTVLITVPVLFLLVPVLLHWIGLFRCFPISRTCTISQAGKNKVGSLKYERFFVQIARVKLHRFCTQGHVCAGVRGGEDDSSNGCYSSTTNKSPGLNWCRIS